MALVALCALPKPPIFVVLPPPRCSSRVWGAHPEVREPPGLCFALQILTEPGALPVSPLCRGAQSFALGAAPKERGEDQKMGFQGFLFFIFYIFWLQKMWQRGDGLAAGLRFLLLFPLHGAGREQPRGPSPRAQRQRRTSCDSGVTARRHYF